MTDLVLWHNPRCAKSREALELLRARGIEPRVFEYLKTPPHAAEVAAVAAALGEPVKSMMRTHEPEYAELGLDERGVSDAALCAAMAGHPRLIQRPILVRGDRAIVGRPPERVLALLVD
jgi:arsenate reductase (glutaredoxin)